MGKKLESKDKYSIGVISDTHGRLPSGLSNAFKDVDLIIHAGDIGEETVLDKLSKIAPVAAVRGNMDFGKWTRHLPESEIIEMGQIVLYVHTHRPDMYEKNGVMFINPGSASYPKFGHPASAALIQVKGDDFNVKLIRLKV
jgi:predicted phosphodiesterase